MNTIGNHKDISFAGRCRYIQDAQLVCHVIEKNFPRISTTKIQPFINNLQKKNKNLYSRCFLYNQLRGNYFRVNNKQEEKIAGIFFWYRNLVARLNYLRVNRFYKDNNKDFDNISQVLRLMKTYHLGNCYESAKTAELILKMNGYKNVCTGNLLCGKLPIEHTVCVFNRDGSKVIGIENNNTIVIDPWAGCVDFANNVFKQYKNMFKDNFGCLNKGKISLTDFSSSKLSQDALEIIKQRNPELIFKH